MAKKKVPAAEATKDQSSADVDIVPEEDKGSEAETRDRFDELLEAEIKRAPVVRRPVEIDAKTLVETVEVQAAGALLEHFGDWTLRFFDPPIEGQDQKVTLIFGHEDKGRLAAILDVAIRAGAPGRLRPCGGLGVYLHAVRYNYLGVEDRLHKEALTYIFRARAVQ